MQVLLDCGNHVCKYCEIGMLPTNIYHDPLNKILYDVLNEP